MNLIGGAEAPNKLAVGDEGTGLFVMGDGQGVGTLSMPSAASIVIAEDNARGTFRGWSRLVSNSTNAFQFGGALSNKGCVVADAYGNDSRVLDMSTVAPTIGENSLVSPGWFAQNHGKLLLPPVTWPGWYPSSPNYVYWGGGSSSWGIINCVQLAFPAQSPQYGSWPVNVSFLARDRTEVPDGAALPSVPDGVFPIGKWLIEPPASGMPFDYADLKFWYDYTAVSSAAEPSLRVYRSKQTTPGGAWSSWADVTGTVVPYSPLSPMNTGTITTAAPVPPATDSFLNACFAVVCPAWTWARNPSSPYPWTGAGNWTFGGQSSQQYPADEEYPAIPDNGGTVTISNGSTAPAAQTLLLGYYNPSVSSMLELSSGGLEVQHLWIGVGDASATGVCQLSGGQLLVDDDMVVGETGHGSVVQSGGTCELSADGLISIGRWCQSVGSYQINGGSIGAVNYWDTIDVTVGEEGSGSLTMTGNVLNNVRNLTVRACDSASGTLSGSGKVGTFITAVGPGYDVDCVLTSNGTVAADGGVLDFRTSRRLRGRSIRRPARPAVAPMAGTLGTVACFCCL